MQPSTAPARLRSLLALFFLRAAHHGGKVVYQALDFSAKAAPAGGK